ncbi:hypothetical protein I5Q82_05810 [Acutalibacter muris]|uniref:ATP-grasp domain-containing protein n=1 Tax=Acutalibacter muris TaxID=1796620 RepID=A0AA92QY97_9FIRM|nr:hypothetical protein [Acutalibacter muris]QQR31189.1 hypothetical protein I5Q82_05810 [Acutalibacter muris]
MKINVLVTAVGNAGVGSQIVEALKLSNLELNIVGTDISNFCIPQLNKFYKVPKATDPDYSMVIDRIISENSIHAIFPNSRAEIKFFLCNRQKYENRGIGIPLNSENIQEICENKYHLFSYLSEKGISVPRFLKINKIEDCYKISFFPVVIKPNILASASEHVYIAFDVEDAICYTTVMLKRGLDIVVQEYVGDMNSEYTIGVTSDNASNILGTIVIHRLYYSAISYKNKFRIGDKSYAISSGITQGEVVQDENIALQAQNIAQCLNSCGPLNIQGMVVNRQLLLFDAHPTITGSVSIRALAGYNEPENFLREKILGQVSRYTYRNIQVMRKLISEIKGE